MAFIRSYIYNNASVGSQVSFDLEFDSSYTITNGTILFIPGGTILPADAVIDSFIEGDYTFYIRVQNSFPFAYVDQVPNIVCSVSIDDTTVTNSSFNGTSDGVIHVAATGSETLYYGIIAGPVTRDFQFSPYFNALPPGTYTILVENYGIGGSCSETIEVTVGFDNVSCDLEITNIQTYSPSSLGGSNGQIIVQSVSDPLLLALEYRLDAGAWQSSNTFTGLSSGTYNVQVRYRDYPSCTDNQDAVVPPGVDGGGGVVCDIIINVISLIHEQSRFANDGMVTLAISSSLGGIQFSIDDGSTFQYSPTFGNLAPGVYEILVINSGGCHTYKTIEIFEFKAPYVDFPIANGHRIVIIAGPMVDPDAPQNFDNRLFADMKFPAVPPGCYNELVNLSDIKTIQWRSSYNDHTLKIYRKSDNVLQASMSPTLKKDFTRQEVSIACMFADAGANKTQVFFENGLPDFAQIGQRVEFTDAEESEFNNVFHIEDIKPGIGAADGYVVLIIDLVYPESDPIAGGTMHVTYDVEPFDVWETAINWGAVAAGEYYFIIEGTDPQFVTFRAQSEPVHVASSHPDTVIIKYKNIDNNFKVFYDTGIEHFIRFEGEFKWPLTGGQETNHEDSNRKLIKLQENVTRNPQLFMNDVPPYLAEKLALICAHDRVNVNGVDHGKQDVQVETEYFDNDPLCNAKIKLRQSDFMAENSDDAGNDVDSPVTVLDINGVLLKVNL